MATVKKFMKFSLALILTGTLFNCSLMYRQVFHRQMVTSWYGREEQGNLTANGEIFNMNHLTAAHKKLPFNTMLRVTNPQNGKSVLVRINDDGPNIRGRHLDLSYAAAKKIDMIEDGVIRTNTKILFLPPGGRWR